MQRLLSLSDASDASFAVSEWGLKRRVEDLYDELLNIPFLEQDYEFFYTFGHLKRRLGH